MQKFSRKNFILWKVQMQSLLVKHDLAFVIRGKEKKPTSMINETWNKTDEKAMVENFLSLSENVLFNLNNETSIKEVWDKLQGMYYMPKCEHTSMSHYFQDCSRMRS